MEERWLSLGVRGWAAWPPKETKIEFDGHELILKPATRDTEQSIHIKVRQWHNNSEDYKIINQFLSILSWCSKGSVSLIEGVGTSIPVPVAKQSNPHGSALPMAFEYFNRKPLADRRSRLALLFTEKASVQIVGCTVFCVFIRLYQLLTVKVRR